MKSKKLLERLLDLKHKNNLSPRSITDVDNLIKKLDNNIKKTETKFLNKPNNILKNQSEVNNTINTEKINKDKTIFDNMDNYPLITDSDLP